MAHNYSNYILNYILNVSKFLKIISWNNLIFNILLKIIYNLFNLLEIENHEWFPLIKFNIEKPAIFLLNIISQNIMYGIIYDSIIFSLVEKVIYYLRININIIIY